MLQWLRDNLRSLSWTLWLVIAAFILLYIPDFLSPGPDSGSTAATVGDEEVSMSEFRRVYRQQVDSYRQRLGDQYSPELLEQLQVPMQVLQGLVASKIQVLEARRLGLRVSDKELRREILKIPYLVDENGHFVDDRVYSRVVRSLGFGTAAEFEDALREELLLRKLHTVLSATVYASDAEVEQSYREGLERAKIRYLQLPRTQLSVEDVSQEDLEAYYEARREEYRLPEQRVASYLLVDQARLRDGIEIPEEELKAYYEANTGDFTRQEQVRARHILLYAGEKRSEEEARAELEELRRRIEAGEDFAALAREYSEDPRSRDRGGDEGYFTRNSKSPAFEEAAFAAAPGELVGPVRNELVTGVGYHLIEVLDHREGGARPFEEMRSQIQFLLAQKRAEELAEQKAREIAGRLAAEEEVSSERLQAIAAEDERLVFEVTPPIGRQDPVPLLGQAPAFNEAAFALTVGEVSDPIQVRRGWTILRLDEVLEPRVPPMEEVESQVRAAVVENRQMELASQRLEEAKAGIASGGSFDGVASELGVEVRESEEFGHGEPIPGLGLNPAISEAALTMEEGQVGGPVTTPSGAVLFQVVERKRFDPQEFAAAEGEARASLEQERLNQILGAIVRQRRQDLVSYNRQLMEDLGGMGADS